MSRCLQLAVLGLLCAVWGCGTAVDANGERGLPSGEKDSTAVDVQAQIAADSVDRGLKEKLSEFRSVLDASGVEEVENVTEILEVLREYLVEELRTLPEESIADFTPHFELLGWYSDVHGKTTDSMRISRPQAFSFTHELLLKFDTMSMMAANKAADFKVLGFGALASAPLGHAASLKAAHVAFTASLLCHLDSILIDGLVPCDLSYINPGSDVTIEVLGAFNAQPIGLFTTEIGLSEMSGDAIASLLLEYLLSGAGDAIEPFVEEIALEIIKHILAKVATNIGKDWDHAFKKAGATAIADITMPLNMRLYRRKVSDLYAAFCKNKNYVLSHFEDLLRDWDVLPDSVNSLIDPVLSLDSKIISVDTNNYEECKGLAPGDTDVQYRAHVYRTGEDAIREFTDIKHLVYFNHNGDGKDIVQHVHVDGQAECYESSDCYDGDDCTLDYCSLGTCLFIPTCIEPGVASLDLHDGQVFSAPNEPAYLTVTGRVAEQGAVQGMEVAIVVDSSGSLEYENFSYQIQGVHALVDSLNVNGVLSAPVGFGQFNTENIPEIGLTKDYSILTNVIDGASYHEGGTSFVAALQLGLNILVANDQQVPPDSVQEIIFLFTDGIADLPTPEIANAVAKGVIINTIGMGSGADNSLLEQDIAEPTGGRHKTIINEADVPGIAEFLGELSGVSSAKIVWEYLGEISPKLKTTRGISANDGELDIANQIGIGGFFKITIPLYFGRNKIAIEGTSIGGEHGEDAATIILTQGPASSGISMEPPSEDPADDHDNCPNDPEKVEPGECGCGSPDIDTDGDGVADCIDNCPDDKNADQADSDSDGTGDACCETSNQSDWIQLAKLTAKNATSLDTFGESVFISGDIAVIGAYQDSVNGNVSGYGSTTIYKYNGTSWIQQAKITNNETRGNRFGESVSVSGDFLVVGARSESSGVGAAYVYYFNGSTWVQHTKLIANDGEENEYFGHSVSISGDTIVVGAFLDDDMGIWAGSAYVFRYDGATWIQQAKLTANDGKSFDYFGTSVSVAENKVVVGASSDSNRRGAAYVFHYDGSVWVQRAKLAASDGEFGDGFGGAVSVSGNEIVIGAAGKDGSGVNLDAGAAYVFLFDGLNWFQQAKLTADDGARSDHFGNSVSISGDIAVVGSHGDWNGSAYVFYCSESSWIQHSKLMAIDGDVNDHFGYSVSIRDNTVIVGAPGNGEGYLISSGAAYLFSVNIP